MVGVDAPTEATPVKRVVHLSSVHDAADPRILHREAKTLAAAGYDVVVVAKHAGEEYADSVRIAPIPVPKNRLSRILLAAPRTALRARALRGDVYHIHDPELLPWAWLLQRMGRRPVVYDVHEYYAESILTKDWIPRFLRRPLSKVVDWLEKAFARSLAAVVTVNADMELSFAKLGAHAVAVSNYPERTLAERVPPSGLKESFDILYLGGASRLRGYELMLRVMEQVSEAEPNARCVVVGPIDRTGISNEATALERALLAENVLLPIGPVPYEAVPRFLAASFIGWVPWRDTPNNRRGMPLKLFEYMSAGLPVVASKIGLIAEIVAGAGCGLLIAPEDVFAHAEAILSLLGDRDRAYELGQAGRSAVLETYNWESQGKHLLALYRELLDGSP